MKVLRVLVGLIFDDWRLVAPLLAGLVLAAACVSLHHRLWAAAIVWIALPVSLWVSTESAARGK